MAKPSTSRSLSLLLSLTVVSIFTAGFGGGGASAQTAEGPANIVNDPLYQDALVYAEDYDVGVDEALRRLRLQDDIGALDAALTEKEPGWFGGLWIEHEPGYRVVVGVTGPGAQKEVGPYVAGTALEKIIETVSVSSSLAALRKRPTLLSQPCERWAHNRM